MPLFVHILLVVFCFLLIYQCFWQQQVERKNYQWNARASYKQRTSHWGHAPVAFHSWLTDEKNRPSSFLTISTRWKCINNILYCSNPGGRQPAEYHVFLRRVLTRQGNPLPYSEILMKRKTIQTETKFRKIFQYGW